LNVFDFKLDKKTPFGVFRFDYIRSNRRPARYATSITAIPKRYGQRSVTTIVIISVNKPTNALTVVAVVEATKSGMLVKITSVVTNHTPEQQKQLTYQKINRKKY